MFGHTYNHLDPRWKKYFDRMPKEIYEVFYSARFGTSISVRYSYRDDKHQVQEKWLFPRFATKPSSEEPDRSKLILDINDKCSLHYTMRSAPLEENLLTLVVQYFEYITHEEVSSQYINTCLTGDYRGPQQERLWKYFEMIGGVAKVHITRLPSKARVRIYTVDDGLLFYLLEFGNGVVRHSTHRYSFEYRMECSGYTNVDLMQVCANLVLADRAMSNGRDKDAREDEEQV
jgi:hypothetical protein